MARGYRRGLCMAEVLITVATIGVLAAILFPVFARAREKSRQATCLGNLVNLSLALRAYAHENDMRYPPRDNDLSPLWPGYIAGEQVFVCPSEARPGSAIMGALPTDEPPAPSGPTEPDATGAPTGIGPGMPAPPPQSGAPRHIVPVNAILAQPPPPPPLGAPPGVPWPPDEPGAAGPTRRTLTTSYFYISGYRYDQLIRRMPLCGDSAIRHNDRGNVLFTDGAAAPWTETDYRAAGLGRAAWIEEQSQWRSDEA